MEQRKRCITWYAGRVAFHPVTRCACFTPLDLPDVPVGDEPVQVQCPNCGRWWEAMGWHPIAEPRPRRAEGPWSSIRWWPDPHAGPYRLRYWYQVVDGQPALVGSELWGRDPVEAPWPFDALEPQATVPLRADATRLRIPELLDGVAQRNIALRSALRQAWAVVVADDLGRGAALAQQKGLDPASPDADAAERMTERLALDEVPERTGRPRTPPEVLREVARIFGESARNRTPYAPAIVEFFEQQGHHISESTARTWKRKAEKAGYLTVPGKEDTSDGQ